MRGTPGVSFGYCKRPSGKCINQVKKPQCEGSLGAKGWFLKNSQTFPRNGHGWPQQDMVATQCEERYLNFCLLILILLFQARTRSYIVSRKGGRGQEKWSKIRFHFLPHLVLQAPIVGMSKERGEALNRLFNCSLNLDWTGYFNTLLPQNGYELSK